MKITLILILAFIPSVAEAYNCLPPGLGNSDRSYQECLEKERWVQMETLRREIQRIDLENRYPRTFPSLR